MAINNTSHTNQRTRLRGWQTIVTATLASIMLWSMSSSLSAAISYEVGDGVTFTNQQLSKVITVPNVEDRILIVGFGSIAENFIDIVPTSLTFGGQELIHAGGIVQNEFTDFYARTDIYYLLNPNIGWGVLSGTVNAANPGGFRQEAVWGMYGMVFSGVHQAAPEVVFTKKQNPFAPSQHLGGSVTTSVDDAMLVGFTSLGAGINNLFSTSGITEVYDVAHSEMNFGAAYKATGAAGSHPFTWVSNGFSTGIGTVAIAELQPATVVPIPPLTWLFALASCALLRGRHARRIQ